MNPLLELNSISYAYHGKNGETKALSDISFQVFPEEFIAIVGPSGCGKSTLLSLIAGLLVPEGGTISFPGTEIPPTGRGCPRPAIGDWEISHAKRGMPPGEGHNPARDIPPEGRGCHPARDIPPEGRGCPRPTIGDWGISHAKRGMPPGEGHNPARDIPPEGRGCLPARAGRSPIKNRFAMGAARNGRIGYMLQKDHLFEWRTIYRNITLGPEIRHRLDESARKRIDTMLREYGLDGFRNAHPSELSGGMRQRAALIRTLANDPELLLLDEPFSALDYQTRLNVCDDVAAILRKERKTVLLVTHDLSEAISMADRIVVLSKRPAHIQVILDVNFPGDQLTPFERRSAPEFSKYFHLLWKELNAGEEHENEEYENKECRQEECGNHVPFSKTISEKS